jgi:hypothetical protein
VAMYVSSSICRFKEEFDSSSEVSMALESSWRGAGHQKLISSGSKFRPAGPWNDGARRQQTALWLITSKPEVAAAVKDFWQARASCTQKTAFNLVLPQTAMS